MNWEDNRASESVTRKSVSNRYMTEISNAQPSAGVLKRGMGKYPAGVSICPNENSSVIFSLVCASKRGDDIAILPPSRPGLKSPLTTRTFNLNELFSLILLSRFLSLQTGNNRASVNTRRNNTTAFLYMTGKSGAPCFGGFTS